MSQTENNRQTLLILPDRMVAVGVLQYVKLDVKTEH